MGACQASARMGSDRKSIHRRAGPSILQGATDETQTQFSIVYSKKLKLQAIATISSRSTHLPAHMETFDFEGQPDAVTKFYFRGLKPQNTYQLEIYNSQTGELLDSREFQTLDSHKKNLRFAFCSCMNDEEHDPLIWQSLLKQNPDVLFFIGDNVYADTGAPREGASPEHLWRRFCEARRTLEIFYSKKLVPILATWDDHDFGLDNSDSLNYVHLPESQKNFEIFFAQAPEFCEHLTSGPGISSAFNWQDQVFLLLDDRSYRLPSHHRNRYGHWGQAQEDWIIQQMDQGFATVWLINGSQFFPSIPFKESVSREHPEQLEGVVQKLTEHSSSVIFVSGDVHFSEITAIPEEILGYPTYELTSSSMHSRGIPGAPHVVRNRHRIAGEGRHNFLLINAPSQSHGQTLHCACILADGRVSFQQDITLKRPELIKKPAFFQNAGSMKL